MSSCLAADSVDVKSVESESDGTDSSLQFFVSSVAANTPLIGSLLADQPAGGGLETTGVGASSFVDFTAVVSPSKVSSDNAAVLRVTLIEGLWARTA